MNIADRKISMRQALMIFIIILGSPSIRIIPAFTSNTAKQAAPLTPFISTLIFILYFYIMQKIFAKYNDKSFMEIIEDNFGKITAKILSVFYFIWVTIQVAHYLRHYAEKILSTIFPNVNMYTFVILMLLVTLYAIRSDLTVFARVNEIIFYIIVIIYMSLNFLNLSNIHLENLYPITHKDIIPIFKGSYIITGLWGYITVVFILSDRIKNKEKTFVYGVWSVILLTILTFFVILTPLGIFGYKLLSKMPIPYFTSVREISLFNTIERVEAFVTAMWTFTDFVIIGILCFSGLHIIKYLFKVSDSKPFINIYMVLIFIITFYLSKRILGYTIFSYNILIPLNIFLGLLVPVLIFIIGKIRKKI